MKQGPKLFVPAIIIIFLLLLTIGRNIVWGHDVSLWFDTTYKSVYKSRPHSMLGLSLAREGYFKEAMVEYDAALKISPYHVNVHLNRGVLNFAIGNIDEAEKWFLSALSLKPGNKQALLNYAVILYKYRGKYDEAFAIFAALSKEEPGNDKYYFNMAEACRLKGDKTCAKTYYGRALEVNSGSEEARKALAALNG